MKSFGRPSRMAENDEPEGLDTDADGFDISDVDVHVHVDPGEAVFGHSPFKPDPLRNLPTPTPIISASSGELRTVTWQNKGGSASVQPPPALRTRHIDLLKDSSLCQPLSDVPV